jgi:diguanylate cyclase (GGDEF)-like protein
MLPSGAAVSAHELAEEIRTSFKQTAPTLMSGEANPTASFGVAIARENENLQALMERADRALYRAKGNGRDRVQLSE